MKLPRRVPWSSVSELDQVCSWIYTNPHDLDATQLAINRLSAWRAITPLPHALESTLALLTAIQHDQSSVSNSVPVSTLAIRHTYATALIRLVNGLVDPLQSGLYARSISSLAAQIGLPLSLVELRHAATHEELPPLEVLRDAARESMAYLLHAYFLPTLSPSSSSRPRAPLVPIAPLLTSYKSLLKQTTRDASLAAHTQYKSQTAKHLRDVERWIAQAKIALGAGPGGSAGVGVGGYGGDDDDDEGSERSALEGLCETLLEKGFLVPLSKKKRTITTQRLILPSPLLALWTPLIVHLHTSHPSFPQVLVSAIFARLFSTVKPDGEDVAHDESYDACLAAWCIWVTDKYSTENVTSSDPDGEDAEFRREDVISSLLVALAKSPSNRHKIAQILLSSLCANYPHLSAAHTTLLPFVQKQQGVQPQKWSENDADLMTERLALLQSALPQNNPPNVATGPIPAHSSSGLVVPLDNDAAQPSIVAPGWRLLDASSGWKPSPMGVFVRVPPL